VALLDLFEGRLALSEIMEMPYSNLKRLYEAKERQLEKQAEQRKKAEKEQPKQPKVYT